MCVCDENVDEKNSNYCHIYIYSWYILYMYYIYTYIYNIYICSPCDEILLVVVKHILEMIPLNCGDASKVCDECPA